MGPKKDMVVYVKLDEYNEVKEIISLARSKIKEARYILGNIAEIRKKEDSQIDAISAELNQVEERVNTVDRVLTEPEV